jgi:L-iditol 2-dehydrogenase
MLHTTNYYPGGFSQYVLVPKINVDYGIYKLPDAMSFEEGTFIEPLACVSRGQRLANIKNTDTVLIIGSGISGILHVQLAKFKGVENIIVSDINPYRLELAKKFGAHHTINAKEAAVPEKLKELTGHLADQVIVSTGALPAANTAMDSVENGGTILFFAVPDPSVKLPVPINQFWRNEITMRTSYGAAPNDIEDSLKTLATGEINVKDMISHRLDIREAQEGFRLTAEAGNSLKVILEPNRI